MKELSEEQAFRLRRNLRDAGCGSAVVERFLELEQQQCRLEQYRMLSRYKASLLQKLHRIQYRIDCLDHLVYTMQHEEKDLGKTP